MRHIECRFDKHCKILLYTTYYILLILYIVVEYIHQTAV